MTVITLFEHERITLGQRLRGPTNQYFEPSDFARLQQFYGSGSPAFRLLHRGIQARSLVGVIQVGDLVLEILPKADRADAAGDTHAWRGQLIAMLRVVHGLRLRAPTESRLALRPGALLHLYFELLVTEVERLLRRGLVRQYRRELNQSPALKGRLELVRHLRRNLVHPERFTVEHDVYDRRHVIHEILAAALQLVAQLNRDSPLASRLAALQLDFPEQAGITVTPALFERLAPKLTTRKFAPYARALHIAELLLLHQHPDLHGGRRKVLALLFDMNALWERFVVACLRRELREDGFAVEAQAATPFWRCGPAAVSLRPDILVTRGAQRLALDTKWKVLPEGHTPSAADLRQLYAYHHYFDCSASALVYPGAGGLRQGAFAKTRHDAPGPELAHVLQIPVVAHDARRWRACIGAAVRGCFARVAD